MSGGHPDNALHLVCDATMVNILIFSDRNFILWLEIILICVLKKWTRCSVPGWLQHGVDDSDEHGSETRVNVSRNSSPIPRSHRDWPFFDSYNASSWGPRRRLKRCPLAVMIRWWNTHLLVNPIQTRSCSWSRQCANSFYHLLDSSKNLDESPKLIKLFILLPNWSFGSTGRWRYFWDEIGLSTCRGRQMTITRDFHLRSKLINAQSRPWRIHASIWQNQADPRTHKSI